MAHTLTTPADAPSGSPVRPRGVLAVASPAPEGWEIGGISTSAVCPTPIIRDKCITFNPEAGENGEPILDSPARPTTAAFPAFMIEQGSECSTLSGGDREKEARDALNDSTDYALGLTLYNGEANDAATSLSEATDEGSFADVVSAVAALECAAAEVGKGAFYTLHASPAVAAYLANAGLIDDEGRSPAGAPWIISAGYPCDDGEDGMQIWATGRVWAAAGQITTYQSVDRPTNNREAWAVRSAIVGFNTCINLSVTIAESGDDA